MNEMIQNFKTNFHREKFLTISVLFALTITFLVLGTFVSIFVFSQTAIKTLEEQAQITIFFKDDFPEDKIVALQDELSQDQRILQIDYISKEEAFKLFTEINKNEPLLLESISANILPASLEIKAVRVADLSTLATEFSEIDGVEEVKFFEDVIDRFKNWSTVVNVVGIVLVVVFLFISFSIVIVALRLTINSKGTELEIQKLVGASDEYVQRPLIQQGILYSVISAVIASVILLLVLNFGVFGPLFDGSDIVLISYLPSLRITSWMYNIILVGGLLLSAVLLGYLGSRTAVKKYLKY